MRYGLMVCVLLTAATGLRAEMLVFEEALEAPPASAWSHRQIEFTPSGKAMLGRFGKQSITLSLNELPKHKWVRVRFNLHICGSWDGDSLSWGPDGFKLSTGDGRTLINTTFSHDLNQAWPGTAGLHRFSQRTGAAQNNTLGYIHGDDAADSTYRIELLFPHFANDLALEFDGFPNEDLDNEFWGLSDVVVSTSKAEPIEATAKLDQTWRALERNPSGHSVWHAVAANERFIQRVEQALNKHELVRPMPIPDSKPHTLTMMMDEKGEGQFEMLTTPQQRRVHNVSHVLRVIGSDRALATLKRIQQLQNEDAYAVHRLTAYVIDHESGKPIPGALVSFRGGDFNYGATTSDTDGKATLTILGPVPKYLGGLCRIDGKVNMRVNWHGISAENCLPDSFTYHMTSGIESKGRLVNENREPVSGASVIAIPRTDRSPFSDGGPFYEYYNMKTETDDQGRWMLRIVPDEIEEVVVQIDRIEQ